LSSRVNFTPIPLSSSRQGGTRVSLYVTPKLDAGNIGVFREWPRVASSLRFRLLLANFDSATKKIDPTSIWGRKAGEEVICSPTNGTQDHLDVYKRLFGSLEVKSFDQQKADDKDVTFKTYDTTGAVKCIVNSTNTLFNFVTQKDRMGHGYHALVSSESGSDLRGLFQTHGPFASGVSPKSAVLELNELGRTLLGRDLRVTWTRTEELSDSVKLDVSIAALRQSAPGEYRALLNTNSRAVETNNPLLALKHFWQRQSRRPGTVAPLPVTPTGGEGNSKQPFDFHQCWSLLGHYPALMRYFGITLELQFDFVADVSRFGAVAVELKDGTPLGSVVPAQPVWVAYDFGSFTPTSSRKEIVNGYLNLHLERPGPNPQPVFTLHTVDVDGTGQELQHYFESMTKQYGTPEEIEIAVIKAPADSLPRPQRTVGLTLSKSGRDLDLHDALQLNNAAESDPYPLFFAEDLVRGYVVDLETDNPDNPQQPREWFPLCARDESYSVDGVEFLKRTSSPPLQPEGLVESSLKLPVSKENRKLEGTAKPINERFALETIAQWVDKLIAVPADQANAIPPSSTPSQDAMWALNVKISDPTGVRKPRKYADARYRMRARVEYVDGTVTPFSPESIPGAPELPKQGPVLLGRREPLGPPALQALPGTDENEADRIVRNVVLISKDEHDPTDDFTTRVIAPPRVKLATAELHVRKNRVPDLIRGFQGLALNHTDGGLEKVAADFDEPAVIPYIPDPLAIEIVAVLYDRVSGKTYGPVRTALYPDAHEVATSAGIPKSWPDAFVHLFELVSGNATDPNLLTILDARERVHSFPGKQRGSQIFSVALPPGHRATLHLQSGWGEKGIARLALMALANDANTPAQTKQEILIWGHPMLTEGVEMSLVHAVRRPGKPATVTLDPSSSHPLPTTRRLAPYLLLRPAHSSSFNEEREVNLDRKATGKLRIRVRWNETRDGGDCTASYKEGSLVATDKQIETDEAVAFAKPTSDSVALKIDTGDTKFRRIHLETTAISRFLAELDETGNCSNCSLVSLSDPIDLLSTAPPDPVDISYMVPTFGWARSPEESPQLFWSQRKGAGLRVFLKGSWLSAGDGELLGVVITPKDCVIAKIKEQNPTIPMMLPDLKSDDMQPEGYLANTLISAWGPDPQRPLQKTSDVLSLQGWDSKSPKVEPRTVPRAPHMEEVAHKAPEAESFYNQADKDGACGWDLSATDEHGLTTSVAVVGYKVVFDPILKACYADIVFDRAPLYGTFVRLALARYQPFSLRGMELSKIVMSDFALLAPDRTLTVTRRKVTVTENGRAKQHDGIGVAIWGIFNPELAAAPANPECPGPDAVKPRRNEYRVVLERKAYKHTDSLEWDDPIEISSMCTWDSHAACDKDVSQRPPNVHSGDSLLWYGEIRRQSCVDRLLVVYEYEFTPADGPRAGKRIFYADALSL
jgi:hypothetical protein